MAHAIAVKPLCVAQFKSAGRATTPGSGIAVQIRVHRATRYVFVQVAQILRRTAALLDAEATTQFRQHNRLCSRADLRADSRLAGDIITAMATPLPDHALRCDVPYRLLGQPRRTASGTQL